MNKWLSLCIFSLLVWLSTANETNAQTLNFEPLWEKEFGYDGLLVETTSNGDLLNVSYSYISEKQDIIYDHYLLEATTGAIKKEVKAIEGHSYIFETLENKLYVATYETAIEKLSLYDEQLNQLWTKHFPATYFENIVSTDYQNERFYFYSENNPLLPAIGLELSGEEVPMPGISYSVPSIELCPGEPICPSAKTIDLHITDANREIDQLITLQPNLPDNHLIEYTAPIIYNESRYYDITSYEQVNWQEADRYFMYIGSSTEEGHFMNRLVEFDLDGAINKELLLPSYKEAFDFTTTDTLFIYAYDDQYVIYDLATLEEKATIPLDGNIMYLFYDVDGLGIVTEKSFHFLNDDLTIKQSIPRPSETHWNLKALTNYYIVSSYDGQPSFIYDIHTLELLGTLPFAEDYVDTNNGQDIISYSSNYITYTYTLQYLQGELLETYPTNKTWKITFNVPIDATTVNHQSIYVMNERGEKVNVELVVENKTIQVLAAGGYVAGYNYTLHVEPDIKSLTGKKLSAGYQKKFHVE